MMLLNNCASFHYEPQRLARGEMTSRARTWGVTFSAGGVTVAESTSLYARLPSYVSCVPRARAHALHAQLNQGFSYGLGLATVAFSIATVTLVAQRSLDSTAFGTGFTTALTLGGTLALRHRALGHAIDAMNYYNDQVGSLGATCADRTYPAAQPMPEAKTSKDSAPADRKLTVTSEKIELLQKIRFAGGKMEISQPAAALLDEVLAVLKSRPSMRIEVAGYSDLRGPEDENKKISQQRADAVRKYLVEHDIDQARLVITGYGPTRPLCHESTPLCDATNRRVEFVIINP